MAELDGWLAEHRRRLFGVLFFGADTPAGHQLRDRALAAGVKKPEKKVKIW